jgi:hypothetical protein
MMQANDRLEIARREITIRKREIRSLMIKILWSNIKRRFLWWLK